MDNLSVSNVHGHMVDCASAVCIENQIARPHLGRFDRSSLSGLLSGGSGQGNSCHMAVNIFDKTGAVRSCVGIVAAPYIPVSYKLETIVDHFISQRLVSIQRTELNRLREGIPHIHIICGHIGGGGIQLNPYPAVQLFRDRISLIIGDLRPDLGILSRLFPGVQTVCGYNGHQLRYLQGLVLGCLACENVICTDITGHRA